MASQSYPDLADFYTGKVLALTGGTGFLGQGLIEKLLRCCPRVKRILIFIRKKKGVEPDDRLSKLWNEPTFDHLREHSPEAFTKLKCIPCDLSDTRLGLSAELWRYFETEVNIFIHAAATLRFNEHIRTSFEINVQVTRRIIKLCKCMENLEAFVHISTAFSNCNRDVIEEKVCPTSTNYKDLEHSLEWMSDQTLHMVLPDLLNKRPNTYTLTKAMAEDAVASECGDLPVCIVRPAMIVAALKDPQPGWITNVYGPTAFIAAYMKGLCRHIVIHNRMKSEIVPIDFVVSMVIAAAMKTACDNHKTSNHKREGEFLAANKSSNYETIPVYHCIIGNENPVMSAVLYDDVIRYNAAHPAIPILPLTDERSATHSAYAVKVFLSQTIPSYILDFFLRCAFQKPRFVMLNKKINAGMDVMEFFFTKAWDFKFDKTRVLLDSLSERDKEIFSFDPSRIDWHSFMYWYCRGVQKFVLKESPQDLEYARKKLFWMQTTLGLAKNLFSLGVAIHLPGAFDVQHLLWQNALTFKC